MPGKKKQAGKNSFLRGIMHVIPFLFLLSLPPFVSAQKSFDFNKTCQLAYYRLMSMHFEAADTLLQSEKKNHPGNLLPYFLDNYEDFFVLAANEDPVEMNRRQSNRQQRLNMLATGPKDSPYYLYTQAMVNLHWGFIYLKLEEYSTAFFAIKKAYAQLTDNQEKFPGFAANKIYLGFIHGVIGTVPDNYKWAANILGFTGTVQQGMKEIQSVMEYAEQNPFIFEDEARYVWIFMKMGLEDDPTGAYDLTNDAEYPTLQFNPLSTFVKGYMATKCNRNEEAIQILSLKNFQNGSFQFHYLDYMLGLAKLRRLDADANIPLKSFVTNFRGENYLKDAYQKLAWHSLLTDDPKNYLYYISYCKWRGGTFSDSDQEALKEAETGIVPNRILLRVRLLQDGGYFEKALKELQGYTVADFKTIHEQIESVYRTGRIHHELEKTDEAIAYYLEAIRMGEYQPYYFAARAALELGSIYENKNDFVNARYYYQKCLKMKNTEYKTSLDQKAKAGLSRLQ